MAIVSEIQESRGLIVLYLDGMQWIRVQKKHFGKLPLAVGQELDPEEYTDRMAAIQSSDCYEAALTILDQAAQSSGDLRRKLLRKGYVAAAADASVERLMENRLLDDRQYAERIAQSQRNRGTGAYAVRRKLRAKHLSEADVEAAMEGFDARQQAEACRNTAAKLWRRYDGLPRREARAKLSQALARRGFGWDVIRSAVDALADDGNDWSDF